MGGFRKGLAAKSCKPLGPLGCLFQLEEDVWFDRSLGLLEAQVLAVSLKGVDPCTKKHKNTHTTGENHAGFRFVRYVMLRTPSCSLVMKGHRRLGFHAATGIQMSPLGQRKPWFYAEECQWLWWTCPRILCSCIIYIYIFIYYIYVCVCRISPSFSKRNDCQTKFSATGSSLIATICSVSWVNDRSTGGWILAAYFSRGRLGTEGIAPMAPPKL